MSEPAHVVANPNTRQKVFREPPMTAACEHLVRIGLVANVPKNLVARRIEYRVERDGELAGAKVRSEVAADLADGVNDVLADLLSELLQLCVIKTIEVLRAVD